MKVVFMGTPDFAVPTLKAIAESEKHSVAAVVTQPDKPKGRGKKILFPPVKEFALENNIPVLQPTKMKDENFVEQLKNCNADVFVVVAYGRILTEEILSIPKFGCINVHGSLLPKYRGAAPIQRAIIEGEVVTGVTIMYMEKGLDTGDMLLKEEIAINSDDTYGSLHDKMAPIGAKALIETLELIENGEATPVKQDNSLSTYAHMIQKDTGHIDWNKNSSEIVNLVRGLNPSPTAYTLYNGEVFKIYKSEEVSNGEKYSGESGCVVDIFNKKGIVVKTGNSAVILTEIQAKGGKKMSAADYLRGHLIEKGTVLL